MGMCQSPRWRPLYQAVVPKCAAMALAVRSHHSAITAFSSAGYAASMQALTPLVGQSPPSPACGFDLDAESLVFHGGLLSGPGLWGCAPALRRDTFIALFAGNSNG